MLYVPWIGERDSFFRCEANASGSAYFYYLEGPFPAGGEFVEPCSVQDPSEDEVASPELPTVHESLMIAPERMVVALLELLKYPFYPLFILDNGMNLISKSLTVLTPA